jgi:PAS domain S-box-containing protein
MRTNKLISFNISAGKIITSANEEACRYFQKAPQELTGKNFTSLFNPSERTKLEQVLLDAANSHSAQQECLYTGKEYLEWIFNPVSSAEKQLTGFNIFAVRCSEAAKNNYVRTNYLYELHSKSQLLTEKELYKFALDSAVLVTGSTIGYLHTITGDQNAVCLAIWNDEATKNCTTTPDEKYELQKAGIWADAIRSKKPVIHNDYPKAQHKKGLPEGHVAVKRHMSLPVIDDGAVRLIIGVGNKDTDYTNEDVISLQLIGDELQKILVQKRTENNLRKISAAIQQSPLLIMILDLHGAVEIVNPRFCNVTGYLSSEVIGRSIDVLRYHDTPDKEYRQIIDQLISGKDWTGVVQVRKKSGELFWTWSYLFPIFNETGQITNYMLMQEDITEQKKSEYQSTILSESLKSVKDCVSITDFDNNITFVNQAFLDTYGYTEEEILGQKISIIRRDKYIKENDRLIAQANLGDYWLGELTNVRKDGSEFPVEVWASTVRDKSGEPIAYVGIARDITERKRIENDLILAKENAEEANRLKTIFLANMSHELRTPMIGILGFSEILIDLLNESEELKGYANVIHNSGTRLLKTLNMLLDFSKVQSEHIALNLKKVNVVSVIADTVNLFMEAAHKKNLYLMFMSKIESLEAVYDERIIRQVAENLINNAISYTSQGGITVTLTKEIVEDKAWLGLKVVDTGVGIPKEKQKLIWEPFRQASEGLNRMSEGTGLGLALVKNFVAKVDGQIYLESEPGKGSTFFVLLPLKFG